MNPLNSSKVRILVADDDADVLQGTAHLLERAGYETATALNGAAALEVMQSFRPDMVLSDRDMPQMDGLEMCRRIKSDPALRDVFVILISGTFTQSEEQTEGMESGADSYIARPIANRELLARVAAFVRIVRLNSSLREKNVALEAEIIERKKMTEALRTSEERLASAMDQAHLAHWEMDATTATFTFNDRFYALYGTTAEREGGYQMSAETYSREFLAPEDQGSVTSNVARLLAGDVNEMQVEHRIKRRDGELRHVLVRVTAIRDASCRVVGTRGVNQDITERKLLEERLRESQKLEGIGRLAGGMAHEFNNILAAMMMNLDLLKMSSHEVEVRDQLCEVEELSVRAADLVKQLLAFSRQSVINVQPVDLAATVSRQCGMLGRLLGERIAVEFSSAISVSWVKADKAMIEQALMNLCLNARDAMKGGGHLRLHLENAEVDAGQAAVHEGVQPGRYVCLSVMDSGCGMNEQTMKRLFEPFFTTKEVGRGTGLGLATVRGIVQQHRGWVEVQSSVGKGSTFRVYLPAVAPPVEVPVSPEPKALVRGRCTILLVEDQPQLRRATRMVLTNTGYVVLEASNTQEALEIWATHGSEIDLILTDMVMPGTQTGLQFVQRVLAEKPSMKTIITSGYNTDIVDLAKIADSSTIYLPKPCEAVTLISVVQQCLQRPKPAEEKRPE